MRFGFGERSKTFLGLTRSVGEEMAIISVITEDRESGLVIPYHMVILSHELLRGK